jgi:hypothetical protein
MGVMSSNQPGKSCLDDGKQKRIFAPIAVVTLEDPVPRTHFYRHLDHDLDLSLKCEQVKEIYLQRGILIHRKAFPADGRWKKLLPT